MHANEMADPKRQFPVAMLIASVAVILLFTLGSFAVATVLPDAQINLQEGLMKAFQDIFARFGIAWATPIVCLLLAFGGIGGVMSWISGPSRGLLWTAQEGEIPPILAKTNKNGVQISILIVQGAIVTVLSLAYFVMADVSVAFFLLSAMTITLYLIMYMLMYAAAIRLRYSQPDLKRSYRVPGGTMGMWIVAGVGFVGVAFSFLVGFFPPTQLPVGSPTLYVWLVVGGTVCVHRLAAADRNDETEVVASGGAGDCADPEGGLTRPTCANDDAATRRRDRSIKIEIAGHISRDLLTPERSGR